VRPELSVVVPVHDVETYLGPCLASLGRQQDAEPIEVVVVDDGSTDSSAQIAARWADAYEGFRLVHQEHQGVSAARNRGVAAASGRYLAFCDADDVVPDDAYSALLDSLRATGSDLASGDVRRLDSRGVRPHPRYRDVFARRRQQTHITTDPELLLDRMPWNKVFRRDFWDRHELRFSLPLYGASARPGRARSPSVSTSPPTSRRA